MGAPLEPTDLQKRLAARRIEKPRESKRKSMLAVGYSERSAEQPGNVMKQESFQQLMDRIMPEKLVVDTHKDLLVNSKNDNVRLGATKLAHQVRGRLNETSSGPVNLMIEFKGEPTRAVEGGTVIDLSASSDL